MAKEIFMPKLSSTMEVGTLLQWFKEEGDSVEMGEPLFEIMTDKINIEVESYEEGILLKKYFNVDDEVEVNACIGYIGEAGRKSLIHLRRLQQRQSQKKKVKAILLLRLPGKR